MGGDAVAVARLALAVARLALAVRLRLGMRRGAAAVCAALRGRRSARVPGRALRSVGLRLTRGLVRIAARPWRSVLARIAVRSTRNGERHRNRSDDAAELLVRHPLSSY